MGPFWNRRSPSVNELILRKDYSKAIELITAELETNARNERLRLRRRQRRRHRRRPR